MKVKFLLDCSLQNICVNFLKIEKIENKYISNLYLLSPELVHLFKLVRI